MAEPELAAFTVVGGAVGQSNHIGRVSQAGDDKFFVVAAQGQDRAEFVRPLDFIFPKGTAYHVRKVIPLRGRGQSGAGGVGNSGRGGGAAVVSKSEIGGQSNGKSDIGVGGVDAGGKNAGIGKIGTGGGEETGAAAALSGGGIIGFGRAHAIFRPVKAVVDPIVAVLQAEGI